MTCSGAYHKGTVNFNLAGWASTSSLQEGAVMSDGAAPCGSALFELMHEKFRESCSQIDSGHSYSAAVIRLMSTIKGVVYENPMMQEDSIGYRKSMKKGNWTEPSTEMKYLRVCSYAKDSRSAMINLQILTLLQVRFQTHSTMLCPCPKRIGVRRAG